MRFVLASRSGHPGIGHEPAWKLSLTTCLETFYSGLTTLEGGGVKQGASRRESASHQQFSIVPLVDLCFLFCPPRALCRSFSGHKARPQRTKREHFLHAKATRKLTPKWSKMVDMLIAIATANANPSFVRLRKAKYTFASHFVLDLRAYSHITARVAVPFHAPTHLSPSVQTDCCGWREPASPCARELRVVLHRSSPSCSHTLGLS